MSLTVTEEALVRQLLDQQAALLSLATSESTIISKLGATKVTLADLTAATVIDDADLLLIRQGTTEKSVSGAVVKALIPDASETVKGIVELATISETITGTDTTRAVHPAGLASLTATETRSGLIELATIAEVQTGTDTTRAVHPAGAAVITQQIMPISASVAASALTVTLNPTSIDFRSATIGSGAVNRRAVSSAISLVVTSGATLGTINAQQSRIVVLAIDNAGTVELAVVNVAGGNNLDETGVISTTIMSSASDSANVIYSTTARTNVPYRVVGYVESTQATAGTWATAPSTIQGAGGNALTAMQSLGYGQTWQNVAGSRAFGTTYYNTTGRPIFVGVTPNSASTGFYSGNLTVNGLVVTALSQTVSTGNYAIPLSGIVPPGGSYSVNISNMAMGGWVELR